VALSIIFDALPRQLDVETDAVQLFQLQLSPLIWHHAGPVLRCRLLRLPADFIDAQMSASYQRTADQSSAIAEYPQLGIAGGYVPLLKQFQRFPGRERCLLIPKW
jgi:hypothetical protein